MKLVCFDCDSTLSAIEGIDELARLRGPGVLREIEAMTRDAMDGTVPLQSVFGRRLEIIRPGLGDVEKIGRLYVENAEPTARETIAALVSQCWTPIIVSGGYAQAIRPLADFLGIWRVEAIDLFFDSAGNYAGFDSNHPASRTGGKPEILRALRRELAPTRTVLVGDGITDLEAAPEADLFVGFGRYAVRERVRREAGAFIMSLGELPKLLE